MKLNIFCNITHLWLRKLSVLPFFAKKIFSREKFSFEILVAIILKPHGQCQRLLPWGRLVTSSTWPNPSFDPGYDKERDVLATFFTLLVTYKSSDLNILSDKIQPTPRERKVMKSSERIRAKKMRRCLPNTFNMASD